MTLDQLGECSAFLKSAERSRLVSEVRKRCWRAARGAAVLRQTEARFVAELDSVVRTEFMTGRFPSADAISPLVKRSFDPEAIIRVAASTKQYGVNPRTVLRSAAVYPTLKPMAEQLKRKLESKSAAECLSSKFLESLRKFLAHYQTEVKCTLLTQGRKSVLRVEAVAITLSEVKERIHKLSKGRGIQVGVHKDHVLYNSNYRYANVFTGGASVLHHDVVGGQVFELARD